MSEYTPWRTPQPLPRFHLFVNPLVDHDVQGMVMLSGSIPLQAHFYLPPESQERPYVLVESAPDNHLRVTLVSNVETEVRIVPWDEQDFQVRIAFGDVLREFARKLKTTKG